MAYEQYESKIIEGYKHDLETGKFIKGNPDLSNSSAKRLYDRFTKEVIKKDFIEYHTQDFTPIKDEDFTTITANIIFQIFGFNDVILSEIKEYFASVIPENNDTFLDGVALCVEEVENPNKKERYTILPSVTNLGAVVTAVHEFIHFHISKYNISLEKKKYYQEIFSIYGEKLAAYYIAVKHEQGNSFIEKIDSTRFESLRWWYKEQLPMVAALPPMYQILKQTAPFDRGNREALHNMENDMPILRCQNGISILTSYYQSQAESYGIGNIYSSYLFIKLLDDPRTTKDKVKKVLTGELSITDLIKYYGMTLDKESTYEPVLKTIKKF